MADEKKLLVGLWDCPYCGSRGINGLKKKCPNCAHTQDAGTKFYLGVERQYLDADKAKNYGKGADWTCAYCGGLNRYDSDLCADCGAPREENTGSYFDNRQREAAKASSERAERKKALAEKQAAAKRQRLKRFGLVAAAILLLIVLLFMPRGKTAEVAELHWERSCDIEALQNVTESGWSLPDGGTLVSSREALHHYDQVIDHYENVEETRSRQVLSGYDTSVSYVDNGDGTFSEQTVETPVYTTEYYTEVVSEPVYRQEPVYATEYTYTIDRWIPERTESASGASDPCWPEVRLADNERISRQEESYLLCARTANGKTYTVSLPEALWRNYSAGDSVKLSVSAGSVVRLDGNRVN